MAIVINPRGTAGSGKTTFARRILAAYGWPEGTGVETLYLRGRERPIAYRLPHPRGGRPLVVLGEYRGVRGGCDTIGQRDGGLAEAFRLSADLTAGGHDVLLEGLLLSAEYELSADFARHHPLHVFRLDVSIERSARALATRRRAGRGSLPALTRKVTAEHAAVSAACARLDGVAMVESLPFEVALKKARSLLRV
ncbi:hypothetical protein [Azospirillum halopraeferens]|uniref:hypothetical protein n=1 Tax=Azospirillum halopraeferens TaxID=34010 RepID=UPI0004113115|nr:hypothetical protein [Azospirillum halopraeferens]